MDLKQFFLLLFFIINFQNNLFCSSEFEKFQIASNFAAGQIFGGGLLAGMGMCLIGIHITSKQTNGIVFNTRTKDSMFLGAIFFLGLGMTFWGAHSLGKIQQQYKDKINS